MRPSHDDLGTLPEATPTATQHPRSAGNGLIAAAIGALMLLVLAVVVLVVALLRSDSDRASTTPRSTPATAKVASESTASTSAPTGATDAPIAATTSAIPTPPPTPAPTTPTTAESLLSTTEATRLADQYLALGSGNDADAFVNQWSFPAIHYGVVRDRASLLQVSRDYFAANPSRAFTRTTPVDIVPLGQDVELTFSFRFSNTKSSGDRTCGDRTLHLTITGVVSGTPKVGGAREEGGRPTAC